MTLDVVLYVAFAGGYVAGRLTRWRSPWIGRAATVSVGVLLFLLGVSLGNLSASSAATEVPLAVVFAAATLAVTVLIQRGLVGPPRPGPAPPSTRPADFRTPLAFVAAVAIGGAFGRGTGFVSGPWTEIVLYILLALVGFELTLDRTQLREAWVPISAAIVGGFVVAGTFFLLGVVPADVALATASAFGWYSLAGPLVAGHLGPALGLFAFLANFLRENATMVVAPWAGPRIGGRGLAAMGGATSMDTTLLFVSKYGGPGASTIGLATGIVLTTLGGVLVPLVLTAL
ncbi:MAG TPA: lysine exporter LysO family protein [Thermoplasmata archaeon]|nr:lysine exporter LysO family protein [Thermoplasmata archaeon]